MTNNNNIDEHYLKWVIEITNQEYNNMYGC